MHGNASSFLVGSDENDPEFLQVYNPDGKVYQLVANKNGFSFWGLEDGPLSKVWEAALKSDLPKLAIDYNKKLTEITTKGASWVATEDCIITGYIRQIESENAPNVFIDEIIVSSILVRGSASAQISVNAFCKKGQKVTTRADFGEYRLTIFALK